MRVQEDGLDGAAQRAEALAESAVAAGPRVGLALVAFGAGWLLARAVRWALERRWRDNRTASFALVMPRLVAWAVLGVTAALAVTVAFPSVDPVDVVAGLGVVSIAAGFAFQDIFSNLLSGLLLIVRQPFVAGDEIEVAGLEGTVLAITIRETEIRTFEGRHIFIPNRQVYQDAITVQTAGPIVRTELLVGCSYDDDLATAAQCAAAAVGSCSGVLADPAPEAYYVAFNDSAVDLELTWWTDAHQAEQRAVRHRVVTAVHRAFAEEGLTIPWPIRTVDLSNVESGVNAPS